MPGTGSARVKHSLRQHVKLWLLAILVLLFGGGAAVAQESPRIEQAPRITTEITYGGDIYEVAAGDGPVVAFVTERNETDAGIEVRGVVVIRDGVGYRIAGEFVDPAPSVLSAARVNDVLVLGSQVGAE